MFVVVIFTIIAIFLTYCESHGKLKNGMFWGFVLITILGCIHYNYGNDYSEYVLMYKEIISEPLRWESLIGGEYLHEPGWVVLNHFFSHVGGFFVMVAVLNIIQNVIYYCFIKNNVFKGDWTLAIMIYLMSNSLYLLNFSMMRQGLAISLFVLAWTFLKKKKFIPSLLIIGITATIHYSAQILIPFALLPFIRMSKQMISVIYVGLVLALYMSKDLLNDAFIAITAMDELRSTQSLELYQDANTTTLTYGWGFAINLIPFVIAMWGLFKRESMIDNEKKLLITLSMVSFIIAPFGQLLPMLGRFGMYFNAYNIASMPFVYSLLPNKKMYQVFLGFYLFMLLFGYYSFFTSDVYSKYYTTFHTIFELL